MLRGRFRDEHVRVLQALPVAFLVAAAAALVTATATGRLPLAFSDTSRAELAAGEDIRVTIDFDKPSYHQGDLIGYRLRLIWRDAQSRPDLEALEHSLSFYPFDERDAEFVEQRAGLGLRELLAEITLQAVDVTVPATYQLDTATVFYTLAAEGHSEVHAVRTTPPTLHLGAYLPEDVSSIPLRPPKPRLDDAAVMRSTLMALCGLTLSGIAAAFLWYRGRRRIYTELPAAEQLWRDLDKHRQAPQKDREYLVGCERLFTAALELRSGMPATDFWAGAVTAGDEWPDVVAEARAAYSAGYRHRPPTAAEIVSAEELVDRLLAPVVRAARLERERHDRFGARLRRQPAVIGIAGALAVAAAAALLLAALPGAWVASDVRDYNGAVGMLEDEDDPQAALDAFLALTDRAAGRKVAAAALYNAGTLLGDFRLMRLSRNQYQNFLYAIFRTDVTLDRLMHDMELDAESELVTLLTELTRRYVQAGDLLKAAVRADPDDADARRNLEILAKIRTAIGRSLESIVRRGEAGDGTEQMLSQTVIDLRLLMEAEFPDEYAREDEGKDDRDYFIMERF
jgi:hypothetical protein